MPNAIVPRGAEHAPILHGLVRKRAEVAGQIERCRAELRDLQASAAHIDATIRLFNPDVRIEAIKPKRELAPHAALHGEVTRAVIDALRAADVPLTSRELAAEVIDARDLDGADRALEVTMAKRVRACLRLHRLKGRVFAVDLGDGPQGWVLIGGKASAHLEERVAQAPLSPRSESSEVVALSRRRGGLG